MKCDEYLNSIMSNAKLLVFLKRIHKHKNVKLLKSMSDKIAYGVITCKDETLFELGEDGYYILYYILHYSFIILSYIIY